MKKTFFSLVCLGGWINIFAQPINEKLQKAFGQFESDSQLKHAISSLYVINAATGQVVFDKNSQVGLAPASTQKIITSVTAFELLGKEYRYKTQFGVSGLRLCVNPSGDPSFGSWRWKQTSVDSVISKLMGALDARNINRIRHIYIDCSGWDTEGIPDGWIWQDIGNYYGAGAHKLNYHENQMDILLRSGKSIGDSVKIVTIEPAEATRRIETFTSKVKAAAKGTGDNAYVYLPDDGVSKYSKYTIRGTIPVNEDRFRISASMTDAEWPVLNLLAYALQEKKQFDVGHGTMYSSNEPLFSEGNYETVYTHYSPPLDSIIYWFNKKSINLYGEALIKTFAWQKTGIGSTDSGVAVVRRFWKEKGLDEDELNIYDGSGLSPLNRVTTHAQVEILKYAKSKDWFSSFYDALPEYNAIKMKSGTISDVKGFCGYHTSKDGKQYIFSFLVNNYTGRSSELVSKMYRVLDVLK